jgi:hypothetical protein
VFSPHEQFPLGGVAQGQQGGQRPTGIYARCPCLAEKGAAGHHLGGEHRRLNKRPPVPAPFDRCDIEAGGSAAEVGADEVVVLGVGAEVDVQAIL